MIKIGLTPSLGASLAFPSLSDPLDSRWHSYSLIAECADILERVYSTTLNSPHEVPHLRAVF
jgi:hypothetical protein